MLPKSRRLSRLEFNKIFRAGKWISSVFFNGKFLAGAPKSGFAFVIAKSVAKTAVARNKIRRRCYNALHELLSEYPETPTIIFISKKGIEKVPFKDLKKEIGAILNKF